MFFNKKLVYTFIVSSMVASYASAMFHNSYLIINLGPKLKNETAANFVQTNLPQVAVSVSPKKEKAEPVLTLDSVKDIDTFGTKETEVTFVPVEEDFGSGLFSDEKEVTYFSITDE